jgi:hypothetical protein
MCVVLAGYVAAWDVPASDLFDAVDQNKDGEVTLVEIAEAMLERDLEWLRETLAALDTNSDGAVSHGEWQLDCEPHHTKSYAPMLTYHPEQGAGTMVTRFCENLPDYLGTLIEEILHQAREMVWSWVSRDALYRIKNYDENKDKVFDRSEFIESQITHAERSHFNKRRALSERVPESSFVGETPRRKAALDSELEAVQNLLKPSKLGRAVPQIVHMIWIPWTRGQRLADENAYNKEFLTNFTARALSENFKTRMWTLSKLRAFTRKEYPGVWEFLWNRIDRPTQLVDFMRLLVVYHFGGVYLQYGSKLFIELAFLLPANKAQTRLFTESLISEEVSAKGVKIPIRRGKPEETIRIANQMFSSVKHGAFLRFCLKKYLKNINTWRVSCDYDILYLGANAMTSEAHGEFKHYHDEKPSLIDLVNAKDTMQVSRFMGKGTWKISPGGLTTNCKELLRAAPENPGTGTRGELR